MGGGAYDVHGTPYPEVTKKLTAEADAIPLGAGGSAPTGDAWRANCAPSVACWVFVGLNLFASLRPGDSLPRIGHASTLKAEGGCRS